MAESAPNADSKPVAEDLAGRDVALEDDERAIELVPAHADGHEKADAYHQQFAERITKLRKREDSSVAEDLEAIPGGFRRTWQAQDHATIVEVAAKVPEDVLREDASC